ncbi:hypothetical protein PAXINDRAFT_18891 [Paxillus involutus ATCC 200175]|uniref:Secreted protein n=1 Tax=Paxillus involutus ATCC 200175 TaxID=664439 RepID=A0A0C9TJ20_PAXIN|nr:hypothetical protein PAXINDRAFT_18891 [Paxillus involutus ATCC 200175]
MFSLSASACVRLISRLVLADLPPSVFSLSGRSACVRLMSCLVLADLHRPCFRSQEVHGACVRLMGCLVLADFDSLCYAQSDAGALPLSVALSPLSASRFQSVHVPPHKLHSRACSRIISSLPSLTIPSPFLQDTTGPSAEIV